MSSKIVLALVITIAVAVSQAQPAGEVNLAAQGAANPWIPPWVAASPWFPQWSPCAVVGPSCLDCSTKLVCTKIGGLQKPCTDPTMPYCNLGQCSATPTAECAPPAPVTENVVE